MKYWRKKEGNSLCHVLKQQLKKKKDLGRRERKQNLEMYMLPLGCQIQATSEPNNFKWNVSFPVGGAWG